eukprot:2039523-Pyramimonas_sp.AAC.1
MVSPTLGHQQEHQRWGPFSEVDPRTHLGEGFMSQADYLRRARKRAFIDCPNTWKHSLDLDPRMDS